MSKEPDDEFLAIFANKLDLSSDFPFLTDDDTITFIRKSKVMIISRGLPGSGKTTLSKKIVNLYGSEQTVICSGDDYFISNEGVYIFDVTKLAEAHTAAQNKAACACQNASSPIIIDNTNIKYWEIKKYLDIARSFDYIVLLVEPKTPHKFNLEKLVELNKHNVPRETIAKRLAEYQIIYPFYFGWFLNTHESVEIVSMVKKIFDECLKECENFKNDLLAKTTKASNEAFDYSSANILHCTAKFLGRNYKNHQDSYLKKTKVLESMGKADKMQLIGISITSKTIAVIVKLSEAQLELWNNDLDFNSIQKLINEDIYFDQIGNRTVELINTIKRGDRAHLTIGLAANTFAVQSGIDLVKNKLKENFNKILNKKISTFETESAKVTYLDDCCCLAYFNKPVFVNSIFGGDY